MPARKLIQRMVTILAGTLLLAPLTPLQPQEAAPAVATTPDRTVKVLRVEPGDAMQVMTLLSIFEVEVRMSEQLGLISVAGSANAVTRAEEALRDIQAQRVKRPTVPVYDNVEMTVHLLGIVDGDSSSMPAGALHEVVAELKKTFPFGGYKLLETFVLHARVGQDAGISGVLPSAQIEGDAYTQYNFSSRIVQIQSNDKSTISINNLALNLRVPVPIPSKPNAFNYTDVGLRTALEVPDGKTVVVGKAGSPGDSQGYLVVLTAKVVR